ncbi:uncharacterized protein LOC127167583 [Labeo rohita]|uniref:uncharacterized protein LOC127167583 n=1 Tax=Labeo rohita TaxID=84645 RepID=UPI0021E2A5C9|nr:uncharacterized protein LOC127167583 [Labeo rohita]
MCPNMQLNHFPDNVQLRGIAAQSSIFEYYRADRAIDGVKYAPGAASFCICTNWEVNPWWRLDLLDNYYISAVTITNRANCCSEGINGAEIRIGNSLENNGNNNPICTVVTSIPAGASYSYSCPDMEGRYVNLFIPREVGFLTLWEVEVYGSLPENIAINGKAVQSSTLRYEANTATDDNNLYCTHTETETNPWWRLDLMDLQIIREVTITNRIDCCVEQMNGAEIRIGNSLENNSNGNLICAEISGIPAGQSVSYSCGGMQGRYVNVVIPGDSKNLTLCEVRVYGNDRVKLSGNAAQSSVFEYYRADRAIDGIKHAPGAASFCTHSMMEKNPWWRLDLLDNYYISTVTITNRADCCSERINGAEIRIGNSLENNGNNNPICAVITSIPAGASYSYSCPDMEGRYVNVVIPRETGILTLCEVEVYGSLPGNLAIGRNAIQSSTHLGWEAGKAIDGIKNNWAQCSSTGYATNPFWRLDLVNIYRVHRVVVTNRIDCCPEHINGAVIRVGNSLENNGSNNSICAVISSIPAGVSYTYLCDWMVGRYVSLVIPGNMKVLTLCEVEVYGTEFMLSRTFIKVKLHSSADLTDPATRDKLLQEVRESCFFPLTLCL